MDSPRQNAISEPELIAGFPESPTPGTTVDQDAPAPHGPRAKTWVLSGLAGAVAASIVWGSALYAVSLRDAGIGARGTVGYRVTDKLCHETLWPGLSSRFVKGREWQSSVTKHPAMDTADCYGQLGAFDDGAYGAHLEVSVVLHKQTDLTAEFEARRAGTGKRFAAGGGGGDTEVHRVHGLADHAYLVTNDFGTGSHWMQLNALDGRAEFTLGLNTRSFGDVSPAPTPKELEPLLVKDLKELMHSLSTSG
ncbi:hypothetical protein AB0F07_29330 [Streptomyces fructofermentans]|uniref:hypothetical protein n=1 Tax=Streptomyces fructofermentans TaxID=152141 RepID=UPI0033E00467